MLLQNCSSHWDSHRNPTSPYHAAAGIRTPGNGGGICPFTVGSGGWAVLLLSSSSSSSSSSGSRSCCTAPRRSPWLQELAGEALQGQVPHAAKDAGTTRSCSARQNSLGSLRQREDALNDSWLCGWDVLWCPPIFGIVRVGLRCCHGLHIKHDGSYCNPWSLRKKILSRRL